MSQALAVPGGMDVEEFLAWAMERDGSWQLIDGEPQEMNPPTLGHGAIQAETTRLLLNHLDARGMPHSVLIGPGIVPWAGAKNNYRIPDVAVTAFPLTEDGWILADPLVIVEVLSPSNRKETWANVASFQSIGSVRDIVVVHSDRVRAQLLHRAADGSWPGAPADLGPEDALHLVSLGFEVALKALYRMTRFSA